MGCLLHESPVPPLQWFGNSAEVEQHEKAKGNKTAQDDAIPPPLGTDPRNQPVDSRDLSRRGCDAPIDTGQRLSLNAKVLIDGVCLRQYPVDHAVTLIQAGSFLEHIFCFRFSGIRASKGINVGADVGKEMLTIALFGYGGF